MSLAGTAIDTLNMARQEVGSTPGCINTNLAAAKPGKIGQTRAEFVGFGQSFADVNDYQLADSVEFHPLVPALKDLVAQLQLVSLQTALYRRRCERQLLAAARMEPVRAIASMTRNVTKCFILE